jgi:4-deoxy-L-threo-5-hexosulose-uronate ketol-isomerase
MKLLQMADEVRYPRMTTAELRATFLIEDLFTPGAVQLVYVDLDRTVIGSAVPLDTELALHSPAELRATWFTERREIGILNIGGAGTVRVGGSAFTLANRDALYVARGDQPVSFSSHDINAPAEFYLLSYPAHATWPTTLIHGADQTPVVLGDAATANRRSIRKLIHLEGARSCQLVMGMTQLDSGSIWNTMPAHTHMRRSEIYLYFDLPASQRVVHFMGPTAETRHLIVANKQVIVSPGWSIHAGAGTASYSFCWGMGGENQVYTDMDPLRIDELL